MSDEKAETPWGGWRWAIVVMVALLLVYPLARWMRGGAGPVATTQAAWQGPLQQSLEHYQAGRYQEAITVARSALAVNPNLAEAYNNLAVSYLQLHLFDEGIQAAQEAIRLRPDFQLAKNNLAWIQREKAKAAGPAVASKPPTPADVLLDQSLQHAQAGRFKECIDTAKESAKLNPGSAQAFNNIGFCAGKLRLWDEAIRNTQEAIRLNPHFQVARNNLAWIQQQKLKAEGPTAK